MRRIALGFTVIVTMLALAAPASATFPGQNGKFAGQSSANGIDSIATRNPDGSAFFQVTTPPSNSDDGNAKWSPNGQRLAFERFTSGIGYDIYVVNADGTGLFQVTQTPDSEDDPAWSPDGTKLVFSRCCRELDVINADGTGLRVLAVDSSNAFYGSPKWSPSGTKIAFNVTPFGGPSDIYTINPDGTGLTNITNTPAFSESTFDWSPDGSKIVFEGYSTTDPTTDVDTYVMNANGSGRLNVTNSPSTYDGEPVFWAPDGSHVLFLSSRDIGGLYLVNPDGTSPTWFEENQPVSDWQPASAVAPAGPVRPKGATPLRVPLVPAFRKCNAPDLSHGAPLGNPSCSRPIQLSQYLTIGTPDANHQGARSDSWVKLGASMGNKGTPANEADMTLDVQVTDVRDGIRLSDYIAELRTLTTVRLTQRVPTQTTTDFPLHWSLQCASTPDPTVGATCGSSTTANALVPGAILEGDRSNWQLGQVQLQDGGEDGEGATESDNTLFMKQGLYVP